MSDLDCFAIIGIIKDILFELLQKYLSTTKQFKWFVLFLQ